VASETPDNDASLTHRLARLPPGRHGLPREFVAANHRDRLIAACVQEVHKRGYVEMTVADIIKTAAVSRRTFYEFFDSKEACFEATYDVVFGHVRDLALEAFGSEQEWPRQVRAALAAMLRFFAEEPRLAHLCMVEPLAAGPPIADHHRDAAGSFAALLDAGQASSGEDPPAGTSEAVVAGIASLLNRRIAAGQAEQLEELLPDIVESALTPFLGAAEAERIARQPAS
jgi:AcrR family transcriptional regulator